MIYTEDSSPQQLLKRIVILCIKKIDLPSASSYIYDLSVFLLAEIHPSNVLLCIHFVSMLLSPNLVYSFFAEK